MKKVFSLLSAVILVFILSTTPALAVAPEEQIIDLGGGFYAVETITQYSLQRSGDMVYGSKTDKIYYGTSLIGTATLAAAFDISGSTAKATEAAITGSGSNGGTYNRGTTSCSGNTATGTAYFKYSGVDRILRISISCSSSGVLS